ncbi:hypothetical protein ACYZTL_06900 [Pseudomonas sp. LB3P81]
METLNHLGFHHDVPHARDISYIKFRNASAAFVETASAKLKIQTPETTKPLTSFEIRGSGYIEFGGEGEIRILRH